MEDIVKNTNELLKIEYDNEMSVYKYTCPQNVNVNEIIFSIAGLIKCFNRDGVLKIEECTELLQKYLTDPQYDELKKEEN